ncbi:MAG: hypothetical protein QM831_44225 [Kofleriaceae bacterium]
MLIAACENDGPPSYSPTVPSATQPGVADPALGITTEMDGVAPMLGDALMAELSGDETAARAGFQKILDTPEAPSAIAAQAALHLAQLEARAGKSRHALDLSARASALAPNDPQINEGIKQIQVDIVAASGGGDLRGPKAGTAVPNVDAKTAEKFAAADRVLVRVHGIRVTDRLSIWAKEDATEEAVGMYRALRDKGAVAQVAADYRIGSLYHDLALALLSADRSHALAYLKSAASAYRASLAGAASPDTELWRLAADAALRSAQDVLRAAGISE